VKARISVGDLREALGIVKPAVNPRAPFVTLDTRETEGIMVAADNHDVQIRTVVNEAWVPDADRGVVAVPHRYLSELVSHLDGGDVEMVAKNVLKVAAGATSMTLPLAPDGEVPDRREPQAAEIGIDVVDWEAIWRVAQHTSDDDNRPQLQSVFFEGDTVAATDSSARLLRGYLYASSSPRP
jgi:DNA polymerase III sliding clamp (beta) subunit (PCNA family)